MVVIRLLWTRQRQAKLGQRPAKVISQAATGRKPWEAASLGHLPFELGLQVRKLKSSFPSAPIKLPGLVLVPLLKLVVKLMVQTPPTGTWRWR